MKGLFVFLAVGIAAASAYTCILPTGEDYLHPHETDCTKFYSCDVAGTAHLMDCPAGLEFNPTLDVCDWPSSAGCSSDPGSGTTAGSGSSTSVDPCITTTSTTTPPTPAC